MMPSFSRLAALLACLFTLGSVEAQAASPKGEGAKKAEEQREPPRRSRSMAIKEVLPSSVRVSVSIGGESVRSASGVVVAARGSGDETVSYVMTNAHVVAKPAAADEAPLVIEILVDRRGMTSSATAEVIAAGKIPDEDLAVLRVKGLALEPATLVEDGILELGDEVVAIGAPFGRGLSVSSGIVSQIEWDEDGKEAALKTDAPIGYGASGGGVFRVSDGKLIAVVEGYRTVKVSFPVEGKQYSFDVPMPGETFAAGAGKIRSFLQSQDLGHLLQSKLADSSKPKQKE